MIKVVNVKDCKDCLFFQYEYEDCGTNHYDCGLSGKRICDNHSGCYGVSKEQIEKEEEILHKRPDWCELPLQVNLLQKRGGE